MATVMEDMGLACRDVPAARGAAPAPPDLDWGQGRRRAMSG